MSHSRNYRALYLIYFSDRKAGGLFSVKCGYETNSTDSLHVGELDEHRLFERFVNPHGHTMPISRARVGASSAWSLSRKTRETICVSVGLLSDLARMVGCSNLGLLRSPLICSRDSFFSSGSSRVPRSQSQMERRRWQAFCIGPISFYSLSHRAFSYF